MGGSMSSSSSPSNLPSTPGPGPGPPPSPPSSAASSSSSTFRPSAIPPPPSPDLGASKNEFAAASLDAPPADDTGLGTFEDLHRKCKDVFPIPFEGAKLVVNKGLSNHFQICHTLTMSSLQPSGYKFGCTYVGNKQFGPTEAYPIMMGEIDPTGNLNATIVHHLTRTLRSRIVSQIQNRKYVVTQLTTDFKGQDCCATLTFGNPDILNGSGVIVGQYLHAVTKNLSLGAELLYQYGPTVPGNQITVYTLAGRYIGNRWQVSSSLTPLAGGVHICYYQKASESLQIGVELEGSLRTQECTATLGYQMDLPKANLTFKGQFDSNWCVGAVLEKKLPPLPFSFALSAFANHAKGAYRFGVGLIVG